MSERRRRPGIAPPPAGPRLKWTTRARRDLRSIGDYIAADDPAAAERWVGVLVKALEKASLAPLAGRIVPEKQRADVREVFRRTYRLVYRVRADGIEVLTVFEGHMFFPDDAGI